MSVFRMISFFKEVIEEEAIIKTAFKGEKSFRGYEKENLNKCAVLQSWGKRGL